MSPTSVDRTRTRSRAVAVVYWLSGALLLAAIGFGVLQWGKTPTGGTRGGATPAQEARTAREPIAPSRTPGWREVLSDDFSGPQLDSSKWTLYSGQPGGDPAGWWDPSHVSLADGALVISGYQDPAFGDRWVTGGVSTVPAASWTYGKFLVRFRLAAGAGIGHTISLVSEDGSWPPEIDLSEDNGRDRDSTLATLHYGPGDTKISRHVAVDLTHWHTLGLEWLPRMLRFTLDGRVWFTIHGPQVPHIPMGLAIQTQTWPCVGTWGVCPNASTPHVVRMYVDWVVVYARSERW